MPENLTPIPRAHGVGRELAPKASLPTHTQAPRSLLEPESDVSVAACVVSPPPLTLRFKDDL